MSRNSVQKHWVFSILGLKKDSKKENLFSLFTLRGQVHDKEDRTR